MNPDLSYMDKWAKWEINNTIKALSMMELLNTPEENMRLQYLKNLRRNKQ